jgi:hypothetical protein
MALALNLIFKNRLVLDRSMLNSQAKNRCLGRCSVVGVVITAFPQDSKIVSSNYVEVGFCA